MWSSAAWAAAAGKEGGKAQSRHLPAVLGHFDSVRPASARSAHAVARKILEVKHRALALNFDRRS